MCMHFSSITSITSPWREKQSLHGPVLTDSQVAALSTRWVHSLPVLDPADGWSCTQTEVCAAAPWCQTPASADFAASIGDRDFLSTSGASQHLRSDPAPSPLECSWCARRSAPDDQTSHVLALGAQRSALKPRRPATHEAIEGSDGREDASGGMREIIT